MSAGEGRRGEELAETMPATGATGAAPANLLHYRVLEKIGEGGMGAVYKAEDQRLGNAEKSAVLFKRGSELQPEDFQCLLLSTVVLGRLGRDAEASAASREGILRAERCLELDPHNMRALALEAGSLVKLGDRARALEWLKRATAVAADGSDVALTYNAACTYALLGEKDAAFQLLEAIIARGFGNRDWVERDSDFDGLRDEPRFPALLAKLG